MNQGKMLFAQLMEFVPCTSVSRIVDRCGGKHNVRSLSCAEQFRVMAFVELTRRESLRDIAGLPHARPHQQQKLTDNAQAMD